EFGRLMGLVRLHVGRQRIARFAPVVAGFRLFVDDRHGYRRRRRGSVIVAGSGRIRGRRHVIVPGSLAGTGLNHARLFSETDLRRVEKAQWSTPGSTPGSTPTTTPTATPIMVAPAPTH